MVCPELCVAGFFGATGVAAGAYGEHALKNKIPDDLRKAWMIGSYYQIMHSAALLGVYALYRIVSATNNTAASKRFHAGFWIIATGMTLFAGNIYGKAFGAPRWMGKLIPTGGFTMVGGWSAVMLAALEM